MQHLIRNELGDKVAKIDVIALGDGLFALGTDWEKGDPELPAPDDGIRVLRQVIEELKERGAHTIVTRVITEQSNLDSSLTGKRAEWHRAVLSGSGLSQGEERVEYRLPLADAMESLGPTTTPRLTWTSVATEPGPELDRAAEILSLVAPTDPDLATVDAARGFLLARKEDTSLVLPPECIQIGRIEKKAVPEADARASGDGTAEREDAAIVIPSVAPKTGWCSLYYMGVLPTFRGQGLGFEVMRHGFEVMASLGGVTYHDGTAAENVAAVALFARFGVDVYRRMEEWASR